MTAHRRHGALLASFTLLAAAAPATAAAAGHHAGRSSHHAAAPGSGLGSLDTTAIAYAVRMPFYSHSGEDVEAEVPFASSTLEFGGTGQSTTSVAWPGDTGAHGGDILDLLNAPVPKSLKKQLNDPEQASAQTAVGKPVVAKNGPGFTMTATARPSKVSAASQAGGSAVPTLGKFFGSSSSTSAVALRGAATAILTARSSVHDVSIAKVLTIKSVVTTAKAVTAAKTSSGSSHTVVSGVTVAGIPVTVDDKGVHVTKKSPKLPLVSPDTVVNKALKQSGLSLSTTRARTHRKGSTVTVTGGTLTIHLGNSQYTGQGNDTGNLLVLGGASLAASSSPGFPFTPVAAVPTPAPTAARAVAPAAATGSTGTGGSAGSSGGVGSSPQVASPPSSQQTPIASAASITLPGGIKAWWVVLVALLAGLTAFGLKRLPDRVLQTAGEPCHLED